MSVVGHPDEWKPDPNSNDAPRANVSNEEKKQMIAALLYERASCEARGLEDRVKLIDAELKRYGHEAAAPARRAERRPAQQGRQSR